MKNKTWTAAVGIAWIFGITTAMKQTDLGKPRMPVFLRQNQATAHIRRFVQDMQEQWPNKERYLTKQSYFKNACNYEQRD